MTRLTVLAVLLAVASPAWAGPVRCTTYEERTLNHLQTLCDGGTLAVSTWSPTLQRWDTTVTPPISSDIRRDRPQSKAPRR